MKLRLSQSKCRSRQRADEPLLHAFHLRCASRGFIVETMEMKEAVNKVEPQLVSNRCSELTSVPLRGLGANDDLAVLKRDHVRRARLVHELAVDPRDAFVGNENDVDLRQLFQHSGFSLPQFQARRKSGLGERLQRGQLHRDPALTIEDADHVNGRDSAWKFRVIRRAPLLNVT